MAAIESLSQELDRRREELSEFYRKMYEEDKVMIEKKASEYIKDIQDLSIADVIKKAYIDGYNFSLEQPLSRSIHLLVMYAYDYVNDKHINMKNSISKIRSIFRDKLHKLDLTCN